MTMKMQMQVSKLKIKALYADEGGLVILDDGITVAAVVNRARTWNKVQVRRVRDGQIEMISENMLVAPLKMTYAVRSGK